MKRGFSLIELLIVIVIIGVVYTLAVTKLKSVGEDKQSPSFLNLKEYLGTYIKTDGDNASLVCLDDCKECLVLVDGVKVDTIESFFDASVERYRYSDYEGAVELAEAVYFNEDGVQEDVCFSFSLQRNKVAQQMIVVYKDKAYDYTSFFSKTKEYESLGDFRDAKEEAYQRVMQ